MASAPDDRTRCHDFCSVLLRIGQGVGDHLIGLEARMLAGNFTARSCITSLLDSRSEFHLEHQAVPCVRWLPARAGRLGRGQNAKSGQAKRLQSEHGRCLSGDLGTSMAKLDGMLL